MKLFSYWRSTTAYRVRAALNLKELDYETVPVDLVAGDQQTEDYKALNPGKGVPTLVLDDGTVLAQSLAIIEYLDTLHPAPRLIPTDPMARAKVVIAAHSVAMDIHPVNNLRVIGQLGSRFDATQQDIQDWMAHWMHAGFAAVEAMLSTDARFAFGDAPDMADLCITAQVYNAHRWGVDLTDYPKIKRVEAASLAVPAIAAAHPENQPDAKETT